MTNTSATGGYLTPVDAVAEDADLDAILQALVVGLAGIPGEMVRPRWQPAPPKMLEVGVDWCAIGVVDSMPDDNAVVRHNGSGDGSDILTRHETLEIQASFYGPHGKAYAGRARDGLWIAQNREAITAAGLGFRGVGDIRSAPELINQQWYRRYDLTISLRRKVERIYPVLNILSAHGVLDLGTDQPIDTEAGAPIATEDGVVLTTEPTTLDWNVEQ